MQTDVALQVLGLALRRNYEEVRVIISQHRVEPDKECLVGIYNEKHILVTYDPVRGYALFHVGQKPYSPYPEPDRVPSEVCETAQQALRRVLAYLGVATPPSEGDRRA